MLQELIKDYILHNNIIITAPTGGGATSLTLFVLDVILKDDLTVLYYNSDSSIETEFIRSYYKNVYNSCIFFEGPLDLFLTLLESKRIVPDYLVLDPGDSVLFEHKILSYIQNSFNGRLICTSQIRQDPSKNQVYSSVEYGHMNLFNYGLWIRDVSEETFLYKRRYVDVFDEKKSGNNFIGRYIAQFKSTGNIIE